VDNRAFFGRCQEEKNLLSLLGIEPGFFRLSAHSLVDIPTELDSILYSVSISRLGPSNYSVVDTRGLISL
jgi:hypothetical protein